MAIKRNADSFLVEITRQRSQDKANVVATLARSVRANAQGARVKALPRAIMILQLWPNLKAAEKRAGRQHIWNLHTFSL